MRYLTKDKGRSEVVLWDCEDPPVYDEASGCWFTSIDRRLRVYEIDACNIVETMTTDDARERFGVYLGPRELMVLPEQLEFDWSID